MRLRMNVCFRSGEGVRDGGEELIVSFRDAKSWPPSRARTDDHGRRWKIPSRRRRRPLGIATCCEARVSLPVRISERCTLTSSTRGLGANFTLTPTYTHVVTNLRHHGNIGTTPNWSSSSDTYSISWSSSLVRSSVTSTQPQPQVMSGTMECNNHYCFACLLLS